MNMNNLQRSFERFNTAANVLRGTGESLISIDLTLWELEDIAQILYEKISSVNPRPKTGHWILIDKEKNKWKCSHCIELGKDDWWSLNEGSPQDNHMDFCPHCGAIMVEP